MTDQGNERNLDVLIVGAGPTGLTLALELARRQISFAIIDKKAGPSITSKALALHSRTLEVFENMGIVGQFLESGIELNTINMFAGDKRLAQLSLDELDSSYPFALSLPQYKTEEILIDCLSKYSIHVEWNKTLTTIDNNSNHVVSTVELDNGTTQSITSNWLVGTDGAHSTVRHQLGLEFIGEKYPATWILGDVKAEGECKENEINLYNSEDGLLAFFPYGKSRFRVVADKTNTMDAEKKETTFTEYDPPTIEELQEAVDKRSNLKVKLSDPKWLSAFSIHCRHVSQYRVNRVFLAGDAAHIHSPAGGQGMNTGIQDAYNLGWKLALSKIGLVKDNFLDSYEEERLAIAKSVLKMTDFITKVNTLKNPLAKHLRDKLAPILSAQEVIQNRIRGQISEQTLNYRRSSIVGEDFPNVMQSVAASAQVGSGPNMHEYIDFKKGPPAGERAPDGYILENGSGDPVRLFEKLKGNEHSVLILTGPYRESLIEQIKRIDQLTRDGTNLKISMYTIIANGEEADQYKELKDLPDHNLYTDWELSLHHKYGAAGDCLYLVRPDGYIGYRSQPVSLEFLSTYLNKHFLNNEVIEISAK